MRAARGRRQEISASKPLFEDGTSLADIKQQQAAEKLIRHSRVLMACTSGTRPVCLVDLVCFVYLVDLVHLVSYVQPKTQTDRTDQMNNRRQHGAGN
jgi:hypothetical protein